MPNYLEAKIYKIIDIDSGDCYIGSTCAKTINVRLSKHINNYNNFLIGTYHYVSSFEIIQRNNFQIILIEAYPCITKEELFKRESFWIKQQTVIVVNKDDPARTKKMYYEENKESILTKKHQYYEANKEQKCKEQLKYYYSNKEKCNEKSLNYYIVNKQKIKEKNCTRIECECGSWINRNEISRHKKTQKHCKFIKN